MRAKFIILGGAGFVGSALARALSREFPGEQIISLDNLKRRGSEMNLPLLKEAGVEFLHGDVRNPEDIASAGAAEWVLDCSAEPSVLAGLDDPRYLVNTNLIGTLNALEYARRNKSRLLFLSTSRVYPINTLEELPFAEKATRFEWNFQGTLNGVSNKGVSEQCPTTGIRSLYGSTKLASELFIEEYAASFGLEFLINRCGVIAGPGQFGKSDQGVFTYWLLAHWLKRPLSYIGYGGEGKQVRDVLHVHDLADLILLQIRNWDSIKGSRFNAGGGQEVSCSLLEATNFCRKLTGNTVPVQSVKENRRNDLRIYVTDNAFIQGRLGWKPRRSIEQIFSDTFEWVQANADAVRKFA